MRKILALLVCISLIGCQIVPSTSEHYIQLFDVYSSRPGASAGGNYILDRISIDGCSGKVPEAMALVPFVLPRKSTVFEGPTPENIERGLFHFNAHCLVQAAKHGQFDTVRWLIESDEMKASPNVTFRAPFQKVETPLMMAIENHDYVMVDYLVQMGALPYIVSDVNKSDTYSSVNHAASLGDTEMIELLLAHGADPNVHVGYVTPLNVAIEGGHLSSAKYLIEHGAFISYKEKEIPVPVDVARKAGHTAFARYLLFLGAIDPDIARERERLAAEQRSKESFNKFMSGLGTVLGAAIGLAAVGAAGYYSSKQASAPRYYVPPPTPLPTSSGGCSSDFQCGIGSTCAKAPYSSTGTCMKSVNQFGVQQFAPPSADSVGPNMSSRGQCQFSTDCPAGFYCDSGLKACVK